MPFTEALRLVIDADTRGAVTGIQKVGATTDRELGRSTKTIDKWGRGLTVAGAGMVALGGAALFGLGKAAMASERADLATLKLENTLQNMPKLAGQNSASYVKLAEELENLTAADADAIVEGMALLGTFNLTEQEIKGIIPLVSDYAQKFGVDIPSAAIQVGKALDGQVGALKRNGVSIDETLFKTDRYAAVQQALNDQVGGFGEQYGKTFAGQLDILQHKLGTLAEEIGAGALPVFESFIGIASSGVGALTRLDGVTGGLVGQVAAVGSVGLVAAGGLSFAVGQAITMRSRFADLASGISGLVGRLGGLKNAALLAAGPAGLLAIGIAIDQINKQQQQGTIDRMAKEFLAAGDSTTKMRDALKELQGTGATEFIGTFEQLLETSIPAAERFVDQLEAMGVSGSTIDKMREAIETTSGAQEQVAEDTDTATSAFADQAEGVDNAKSSLQEYSDTLKGMTDPLFAAMDAVTSVRDAQLAQGDAAAEVAEAQVALTEALASGDPAAIAEATRGLEDAQRGLSDAQWATVESAAQADSALGGLTDAVRNGDVDFAVFKDTLAQWVDQGFLTQEQANLAMASVSDLADEADRAAGKRVRIPVSETDGARTRGTLNEVQQAAINAGRQRPNVRVSATDRASGVLEHVSGLIRGIPSRKTLTFDVNVTGMQELNRARALTGRQHGGPVLAREAYLVGEAGPELLLMGNQSGTIVPHGVSVPGGGMAGRVAGQVVNVMYALTFNGPTNDKQVVEALKREVRANGPLDVAVRR